MAPRFDFTIAATDGKARTGAIAMRRGTIRTPAFMPVGTAATVKAMKPADVRATRRGHHPRQHLSSDAAPRRRAGRAAGRAARVHGLGPPDPDRQRRLSGDEPVRADQAQRGGRGVQEPSRRHRATCSPPNARWRSSGCSAPTSSWRSTNCVPTTSTREVQAAAMERSMRWAKRSRAMPSMRGGEHAERAALFGIQQGALDEGLRKASRRCADRHRLRRLCGRRARGRRGAGGDVRRARFRARPACRPTSRAI